MNEYHKIQTVFLRDPSTKYKTLLEDQFALPEFEFLANNTWQFTEKVDGINIRVMFDGENFRFGGKTDNAQIPALLYAALQDVFIPRLYMFKDKFPDGVCLYGEGYGAKIQKGGGNYRSDQGFVLFDVKVGEWWLKRDDVVSTASALQIDVVPLVGTGTLREMVEIARAGFKSRWGDFTAEGIVARPDVELFDRGGRRIITKIKTRDFAAA